MNPLIYKLSVRNGVIISVISCVFTIVLYLINPLIQYTSYIALCLSVVVGITLLVMLALDVRRNIGGFWNFGNAFLSLMIISVIVVFANILLNFIIFKFVDPNMPTKVNEALLEAISNGYEKAGLSQDQIDNATKPFTDGENIAKLQPTLINELKGICLYILIYGIVNLIIAACIKKEPPMFTPVSDSDIIESN